MQKLEQKDGQRPKTRPRLVTSPTASLRGSLVIPGKMQGEQKQAEDIAVTSHASGFYLTAAIDGVSARAWEKIMKSLCHSIEEFSAEGIQQAIIELAEKMFGEEAEEELRAAVLSFTISSNQDGKWRHIAIWSGDGGVAFLPKSGHTSFIEVRHSTYSLPVDFIKHINPMGSRVSPNRILKGLEPIEGRDILSVLSDEDRAFFTVFEGEGTLISYTDGVTDAFLGYLRKHDRDPSKMHPQDIKRTAAHFFREIERSLAQDLEKLERALKLYAERDDSTRDDIGLAYIEF